MNTNLLHPMQDSLRLLSTEMWLMCLFVIRGGYFNEKALKEHNPKRTSLIALARTEDGELWIRDGLHRICVIHLFGRELREDEYEIEDHTYAQFQTINPQCGWVTPLDIRTEVRKADFFDFKEEAMRLVREGKDPAEFIMSNRHRYCVPRMSMNGFADLIKNSDLSKQGILGLMVANFADHYGGHHDARNH